MSLGIGALPEVDLGRLLFARFFVEFTQHLL
jgi:hypothetical protein